MAAALAAQLAVGKMPQQPSSPRERLRRPPATCGNLSRLASLPSLSGGARGAPRFPLQPSTLFTVLPLSLSLFVFHNHTTLGTSCDLSLLSSSSPMHYVLYKQNIPRGVLLESRTLPFSTYHSFPQFTV